MVKTGEGFGKFFGVFKLYYFIGNSAGLVEPPGIKLSIKLPISSYTLIISFASVPYAVLNRLERPRGRRLPLASRPIATLRHAYRVATVYLLP